MHPRVYVIDKWTIEWTLWMVYLGKSMIWKIRELTQPLEYDYVNGHLKGLGLIVIVIVIVSLKGNCAPEKPFDFSYLPKKNLKNYDFCKKTQVKSFSRSKVMASFVYFDDVIFDKLLKNEEFFLYFSY